MLKTKNERVLVYAVLNVTRGSSESVGQIRVIAVDGLDLANYDPVLFEQKPWEEKIQTSRTWQINLEARDDQLLFDLGIEGGLSPLERVVVQDVNCDGRDELILVGSRGKTVVLEQL